MSKIGEIIKNLMMNGQMLEAEALLSQLLISNPVDPLANEYLAYIYGGRGDMDKAISLLQLATASPACSAEAHYELGSIFLSMDRYLEAEASLRKAVASKHEFFEALHDLGVVLAHQDKKEDAAEVFLSASKLRPDSYELIYNIARLYDEEKKTSLALSYYEKALSLKPDFKDALLNKGANLVVLGRYDEAIKTYEQSLKVDPNSKEAWSGKGEALIQLKQFDLALSCLDKAISIDANYAAGWFAKGIYFYARRQFHEAIKCYDQSLKILPSNPRPLVGKAAALYALLELESALEACNEALRVAPNFASAKWNRALIHLALGNYKEGWADYESRWMSEYPATHFHPDVPKLEHLDRVQNKKVLLWCEQGFGDSIQFIRYLPTLREAGAKIILEVQEPLRKLFSQFDVEVISRGDAYTSVDYQLPLGSLPGLVYSEIDLMPPMAPYIFVPPDLVENWRRRLNLDSARPNVGIACSGNTTVDARNGNIRPIDLSLFAGLKNTANLYLIQKELRPEDQAFLVQNPDITFLGDQIVDFSDTAAIVENMDLIISIDTSLAHLAGALAKPIWVLLAHAPDWRWMIGVNEKAWYRTVKLYRQNAPGEWLDVMKRVSRDLQDFEPGK